MSTLEIVSLVLAGWVMAALAAGLLVGRIARRRDDQRRDDRRWGDGPPGLAAPVPGGSPAQRDAPTSPEQRRQSAVRAELQRLLAELDRAELDGSPGEIADLARIWAARASSVSAEQVLNQAIDRARRNGRSWTTIKIVLDLPSPSRLESSPEQR